MSSPSSASDSPKSVTSTGKADAETEVVVEAGKVVVLVVVVVVVAVISGRKKSGKNNHKKELDSLEKEKIRSSSNELGSLPNKYLLLPIADRGQC